jgi:hypothetical protein
MSASILGTAISFRDHVGGGGARPIRRGARFSWPVRRPSKIACSIMLGLIVSVSSATLAKARVINEQDLQKISEINTIFASLANYIAQALKRAAGSSDESDCLKSIQQEVVRTPEELSSYQYLLNIVSEMDDYGDDKTLKSLIRFALDRSIAMLDNERKRLSQVPEECIRFPSSTAAAQQALRFIDLTSEALKSVRPRF